jgi:hypothetical protein
MGLKPTVLREIGEKTYAYIHTTRVNASERVGDPVFRWTITTTDMRIKYENWTEGIISRGETAYVRGMCGFRDEGGASLGG